MGALASRRGEGAHAFISLARPTDASGWTAIVGVGSRWRPSATGFLLAAHSPPAQQPEGIGPAFCLLHMRRLAP